MKTFLFSAGAVVLICAVLARVGFVDVAQRIFELMGLRKRPGDLGYREPFEHDEWRK